MDQVNPKPLQSSEALTLVGLARLQNVAQLVLDVASKAVPGDFVEAGAWVDVDEWTYGSFPKLGGGWFRV